jgi:hypothetical protein
VDTFRSNLHQITHTKRLRDGARSRDSARGKATESAFGRVSHSAKTGVVKIRLRKIAFHYTRPIAAKVALQQKVILHKTPANTG